MRPAEILKAPFPLETVPARPAVFLIHAAEGAPYMARTASLKRRLGRLLFASEKSNRRLMLGGVAARVEYWALESRLESSLLMYELAQRYYPDDYAKRLRLRPAAFVRLVMGNEYPRTQVTTRVAGGSSRYYGPFRSRASAEEFEQEALDLFQVRRCQEDLAPSPEHPGCIYGEMMKCLRPCQQVVGADEYRGEAERLAEFLHSNGRSMLEAAAAARDRLSEEMNFEEAQRQHHRYLRIEQALKKRDDLSAELSRLNGVAVCPGAEPGRVDLLFLIQGIWAAPIEFSVAASGEMTPMDRRLREAVAGLSVPKLRIAERNDHLSILAKWYYSSARTEEWIGFEALEELPYRRLVRAISKTARGGQMELFAG